MNGKRSLALVGMAVALGLAALPAEAAAATTTAVSMTFSEPILEDIQSGCPALALPNGGFCGNGIVVPFGHATEMIAFSGGCGGSCDLRTVTLGGGSITIDEFFSSPSCPGVCQPNPAAPFAGTLNDLIVGGTGKFAGASGNVSGTVKADGPQSLIQLSGTITLPT